MSQKNKFKLKAFLQKNKNNKKMKLKQEFFFNVYTLKVAQMEFKTI